MRFKIKVKQDPSWDVGKKRTRERFAWWPTRVDDDSEPMYVWLEKYVVQETLAALERGDGYTHWMDYQWIVDGKWSKDILVEEGMKQIKEDSK